MFDYIPFDGGIEGCPLKRFQTKDTDAQWMDHYFVTIDGQLEHEEYDLVETPRAERPFPDAPEGSLMALCGALSRTNIRRVPEHITGEIEFYGDGYEGLRSIGLQGEGDKEWNAEKGAMEPVREREWFEYVATFENGKLAGAPRRVSPEEGR